MSSSRKQKERLLMLLLALLMLSIAANFLPEHLTPSAPPPLSKSQLPDPDVRDELPSLSRLNTPPARFAEVHRNIFDFTSQDSAGSNVEEIAPETETSEVAETGPSGPTLPEIRYVGYYREKAPSTTRLASLLIAGHIFVGAVGDVVNQQCKLTKISPDHVMIQLLSDQRIFRLPLGKNAAPIPMIR